MTRDTKIEIKDPRPDFRIEVEPPAEAGLPYKAVIRRDYSWMADFEDPTWNGLKEQLYDWLSGLAEAALAVRGRLDKVTTPPPLPEPPEASEEADAEVEVEIATLDCPGPLRGWPVVVDKDG